MNPVEPASLWEATSEEEDVGRQCLPDGGCDVIVVGGGFTGLSAAVHCAEKGLSVHVLEAKRVGFGGSGRNVGLVNAGAWLPPDAIRRLLGETHGPRFLETFGNAPEMVFELVEKHGIRCEATKTGTIHAAHAPRGLAELMMRHAAWRQRGAPVELLTRKEIASLTGTRAFCGGLLDRRAGTINPMAFCRGLARVAAAAGAEICIGTNVVRLARIDGGWRVETNRGSSSAKSVLLATNAYTDELWPGLSKSFTTIRFLQLSTPPLGPEADSVLPGRQGLWDTGRVMLSFRRDEAKRLIVGTMGRVVGQVDSGLSRRWAARQVERIFPNLGPIEFDRAWHGKIAMTPDRLPRIHQLEEGLWTAIGYNGRGITTGTILGQSLADLLAGSDPSDLPLPLTDQTVVPFAGLRSLLVDLALTASQFGRSL